jgi:hypothetical protein
MSVCGLLPSTLLTLAAVGLFGGPRGSNLQLVSPQELVVPFQVTGRLLIGGATTRERPIVSDPPQIALAHSVDGRDRHVSSLVRLAGSVVIRSETEALAFVRLRTSPLTVYAFDLEVEVMSPDRVDLEAAYGDRELLATLKGSSNGYWGMLDRESQRQISVDEAIVIRRGDRFTITRTLLTLNASRSHHRLVTVRETVGRRGSYRREVVGIRRAPASIAWWIPTR